MAAQVPERVDRLHLFFPHLTAAEQIEERIGDCRSVLFVTPRWCLKSEMLRQLTLRHRPQSAMLSLSLLPSGGLDYLQVWDQLRRQVDKRARTPVSSLSTLEAGLYRVLSRRTKALVLCINGPRGSASREYSRLLSMLNRVVETSFATKSPLVVVAAADFSIRTRTSFPVSPSPWSHLETIDSDSVDAATIAEWLLTRDQLSGAATDAKTLRPVADRVEAATGGHPGLVYEAINWLSEPSRHVATEDLDESLLRDSSVLKRISQVLLGNPLALTSCALSFEAPSFCRVYDPDISRLIEIGVLKSVGLGRFSLYGGVVTQLTRELHEEASRPAPAPRGSGLRNPVRDEPDLPPEPGDLVVLHISDLHVSEEDYGHRLDVGARSLNRDNYKLSRLLKADLEQMGLLGRVNGLVVTGDIVKNGAIAAQYERARDVMQEIVDDLGLGIEQVLVVPGNHDLDWHPASLDTNLNESGASLQNFRSFCEKLGLPAEFPLVRRFTAKESSIIIAGLNSDAVESEHQAGIGLVSLEEMDELERELERQDIRTPLWLAFHHHVFPISTPSRSAIEARRITVMANAAQVQNVAGTLGAELLLHGHEHQPNITSASRWPAYEGSKTDGVLCIGAGSAGARQGLLGNIGRNHYFVLVRREHTLSVKSRYLGEQGLSFVSHANLEYELPRLTHPSSLRMGKARHDS